VRGSQQEELRKQVLALLADLTLDALVYATFDHPPALVAEAALTNPKIDIQGLGSNRRLSAVTGFPALTIPAGTATDGMPVGIEFMGRPFTEPLLLKVGYAYEQGTHHRKPPRSRPNCRTSHSSAGTKPQHSNRCAHVSWAASC
jgi:amidase